MSREEANKDDKFVAMVSAKAEVDLRLSDYTPRSELKVAAHTIEQPRFPVIDYHNHLDAQSPQDMLRVMDACGVEKLVNITMKTGQAAIDSIDRFHRAAPGPCGCGRPTSAADRHCAPLRAHGGTHWKRSGSTLRAGGNM